VADPEILEEGAEDNVSAPSSFIANAHDTINYTRFIREKVTYLKTLKEVNRGPPPRPLLNPSLAGSGMERGEWRLLPYLTRRFRGTCGPF